MKYFIDESYFDGQLLLVAITTNRNLDKFIAKNYKVLKSKNNKSSGIFHSWEEKPKIRERLLNNILKIVDLEIYYRLVSYKSDFNKKYNTEVNKFCRDLPDYKDSVIHVDKKYTNKKLNQELKILLPVNCEISDDQKIKGLQVADSVCWAIKEMIKENLRDDKTLPPRKGRIHGRATGI